MCSLTIDLAAQGGRAWAQTKGLRVFLSCFQMYHIHVCMRERESIWIARACARALSLFLSFSLSLWRESKNDADRDRERGRTDREKDRQKERQTERETERERVPAWPIHSSKQKAQSRALKHAVNTVFLKNPCNPCKQKAYSRAPKHAVNTVFSLSQKIPVPPHRSGIKKKMEYSKRGIRRGIFLFFFFSHRFWINKKKGIFEEMWGAGTGWDTKGTADLRARGCDQDAARNVA